MLGTLSFIFTCFSLSGRRPSAHYLTLCFTKAAESLWGYKITEVVGRNVKILMPSPERERHDEYIKRYLETGAQRVFGMGRDVTVMQKDGTLVPVRLSVSEQKDGPKRFWTGIVQKLSE